MIALAIVLGLLGVPAQAQESCAGFDTSGGKPHLNPIVCPDRTGPADRRLPAAQLGTYWRRRGGEGEYRSEIWLRPTPQGPMIFGLTPDRPLLVRAVRVDAQGFHVVTPRAEDFVYWAQAEEALGRPEWAAAQVRLGLTAAPQDKTLKAMQARLPALWDSRSPFAHYITMQSMENGHRLLEHGEAAAAIAWLDCAIASIPTVEAYFMRSQAEHHMGRDEKALADAEAGLRMAPNDTMLLSAREQAASALQAAARAQGRAAVPVAAVAQAPAAAPPSGPARLAAAAPVAAGSAQGGPILNAPEPPVAAPARQAPPAPGGFPLIFVTIVLVVAVLVGAVSGDFVRRRGAPAAPLPVPASEALTVREGLPALSGYEVRRQIGAGGMGLVFEGARRGPGDRVAIKQMRRELRERAEERDNFLAEARIASRLKHPSIVAFHEVVEERGELFLVFDYVDGEPLSELLRRKKRLSVPDTQQLFTQVCEAISCAHREHVLHRDLKPSNIMVEAGGGARVMDFGIARQAKDTITRLTRTDLSGTPAYMAPEQHLGRCNKASDIYSLGVCLYEALTGKLPFPGPDFLAQKERMIYLPPGFVVPGLPKVAELLFQVTLAADPAKRVADAEELIESLRRLLA